VDLEGAAVAKLLERKVALVTGAGRSRPRRSKAVRDVHSVDWELHLGYLIHDVSRLRRSAFDRCLKSLNVTRSQWWVLAYLSREDGMTQTRLAEQLDVGKVAMGGLIDRIEKSGLVKRVADASDRRVNRIFLEPPSKRLIAQMREISHQFNGEILAGVGDSELKTTASALHAIKRNLLRYLEASGNGSDRRPDLGKRRAQAPRPA
jgi:DNA-binding MarR family transcriptional regulator